MGLVNLWTECANMFWALSPHHSDMHPPSACGVDVVVLFLMEQAEAKIREIKLSTICYL